LGNGKRLVKMTYKFNLGKWVEGEMIVFESYLILETCKFTLKPKLAFAWKMGRPRLKILGRCYIKRNYK
jgi:hypothetical protein